MNTHKKIVFLVGTRIYGILGPCKLLIPSLREKGYEVHLFGRLDDHFPTIYADNCVIHSLNVKRSYSSFFFDLLDILKLIFYIKKLKPKHIHSFNPKPQLICFFAALFQPSLRYYIGVTGLGNTFIKARSAKFFIKFFMHFSLMRAKYVFFQNEYDQSLFQKQLGLKTSKSMLFRSPGVDLSIFQYTPPEKNYQGSKLRILFVGRLIWQKGVDDFINVYKSINSSEFAPDFEFTLVGSIDEEHPDRLDHSDIDFIRQSNINWIEWTDNINSIYKSSHVLLFMSDREGGPRAILEASAVGRPTIGCNSPGVNQLIIDSQTGFLIEKGDIQKIIQILFKYRDEMDLINSHGKNARRLIAEPLSLENATSAQLKMYL